MQCRQILFTMKCELNPLLTKSNAHWSKGHRGFHVKYVGASSWPPWNTWRVFCQEAWTRPFSSSDAEHPPLLTEVITKPIIQDIIETEPPDPKHCSSSFPHPPHRSISSQTVSSHHFQPTFLFLCLLLWLSACQAFKADLSWKSRWSIRASSVRCLGNDRVPPGSKLAFWTKALPALSQCGKVAQQPNAFSPELTVLRLKFKFEALPPMT